MAKDYAILIREMHIFLHICENMYIDIYAVLGYILGIYSYIITVLRYLKWKQFIPVISC